MRIISNLLFCFALSFWVHASATADGQATDPNILWIILEDTNSWLGCYGDETVATPAMDRLAEGGVLLERFYVPAAVCSPVRSGIITGMMPTSIGAHNHRSARAVFRGEDMGEYDRNPLPDGVTPLPMLFREAGYWTFNSGGKDDYNFEWDAATFYDFLNSDETRSGHREFIEGDALDGKRTDQPFFGQIQLKAGKLADKAPKIVDPSNVDVPPYYPDIPGIRKAIAHHYDTIAATDRQVGEILRYLEASGLAENTVVFLFSDHGMALLRHKQFLYEGGIRVPCIIAGPGIPRGVVRDDLISGIDLAATTLAVAGLPVPPAMEARDLFDSDHREREFVVATRDRCDWTIDRIRAVVTERHKYIRNFKPGRPYMQPQYRDAWPITRRLREMADAGEMTDVQMAFFGPERPVEELYHLENDPHEIHNLAADPDSRPVLERHRRILGQWIQETDDAGQYPESATGLRCVLKRWGDKCVNLEYYRVRPLSTDY